MAENETSFTNYVAQISIFSFSSILIISCRAADVKSDEPAVPQGEVTREFLSQIRVGKDCNFQYWNQDSPALKALKAFVATVTDPNSKGYVPPQDGVATFDVDGTLMCETAPFAIYVLEMNSYVILYQVEVIERNGFRQQEVQSDCLLADQILRTVRMPFVNFLVQAGRISAGMWIGLICAFLTGGLILSDKSKK